MGNVTTTSQDEKMFGDKILSFSILKDASEKYPLIADQFENFKKAIENFNSIGIEVDISLRFDSVIFQEDTV